MTGGSSITIRRRARTRYRGRLPSPRKTSAAMISVRAARERNTRGAADFTKPSHQRSSPDGYEAVVASRCCSSHNIRAGRCITQLNDVAFFVMVGNLILCEARPPRCLCKPINSVLSFAYCKLSTQPSLCPKLHNLLHELDSSRVNTIYSSTI